MQMSDVKRQLARIFLTSMPIVDPMVIESEQAHPPGHAQDDPLIPAGEVFFEIGLIVAALLGIAVLVHLVCAMYPAG